MYTREALRDLHDRAHANLAKLLRHCGTLTVAELDHEILIDDEVMLTPARVVLRTVTHLDHHQGQVVAMCRLLGKPTGGLDFPHD